MAISHQVVAAARDTQLEVMGVNKAQRHLMANRTPERDCIVDDFKEIRMIFRAHGIDADHILGDLIARLRQVIELNDLEYSGEHAVAGTLDEFARRLHRAERDPDQASPLGVKDLAGQLRPHLRALADYPEQPLRDIIAAVRVIDALAAAAPTSQLHSGSLRHELGRGLHDQLTTMHPEGVLA